MRKQIFDRTKRMLSTLFVVFFIASMMATISAAGCWNGKENFNKGSFNGNCNGNANYGSFNGNNNGDMNIGNQACGCSFPTC
jgi:hypothetical protein